tara:strand:- start:17879 stop:18349 length:471 start_codon:yes stop_codon:yes gene_type:complete
MNRYDKILDWLRNEHDEVFNQWTQIEEVMNLEAEQREKAEAKARFEREEKELISQYEWFKENYEIVSARITNERTRQAVMFSFDTMFDAVKKGRYDMVSTYKTAIRSLVRDSNLSTLGYLKDGRRVITPFNHCWSHNHSNDVKFDSNAEYDWREEE